MTRIEPSSERGVAMIVVLMVLIAATMLGTVALSAAGADMPFARDSQDRKQAYAAAEAGVEYYLYQLSQDNDYWTKCATGAAPNPGEPNPVVQRWVKPAPDTRTGHWRKVPGAKAEYAIELMPDAADNKCVINDDGKSMLDQDSGTFRIRSTGRINGQVRSIVATLRRKSFLDYLYFTNFETHDPAVYGTQTMRDWASNNCQQMRDDRPSGCVDITFRSDDAINGPFHTNDDILTCGGTTLGRTKADAIEISGPHAPGWKNKSGCSGSPNMKGTLQSGAEPLEIPPTSTNTQLAAAAVAPYKFTGATDIELNGTTMRHKAHSSGTWSAPIAMPPNGVIYVNNGACSGTTSPALARYNESAGCGNLYVHGTYAKNLTIASANDIIIDGNITMVPNTDTVLGLIADNFVRVKHQVTRSDWNDMDSCSNVSGGTMQNVTIEAAILALKHSFIVDNHACGAALGTLTVKGAIAQRFRGVVGTFTPTGYLKDYNYDDRLRYRSPPFFIDPVSASWKVIRVNEQVPAWK